VREDAKREIALLESSSGDGEIDQREYHEIPKQYAEAYLYRLLSRERTKKGVLEIKSDLLKEKEGVANN